MVDTNIIEETIANLISKDIQRRVDTLIELLSINDIDKKEALSLCGFPTKLIQGLNDN